ncbi:uncharacterized protein LOC124620289 [Schistocerca americana]|uniref:uncharacterized protein LOC124620289 n=1 Tax=Schistocerca americana TaxID=7009 RepID=UPI001F5010A3|nr:uncharacterized protein LOC124620289 [Schistocerca americana]
MTIDNMKVYYSGNSDSQHRNGVGIILDEYATHKDQEEIGKFYEELTQAIGTSKSRDIIIIMGDFNAKIGEGSEGDLIGPFGLGTRNERGDLLSQFCQENNLSITNTFLKLPKRRLYTWKSPRDCNEEVCRNQIDFILINKRYKNSIHGVKTYPGADIFSDHKLLVAKFHVKLKAIQKKQEKDYINTTILRDPLTKQKTSEEINKELVRIKNNQTEDIDGKWEPIKDTLNNACKNTMATKHDNMKKKWMTEKILQLMEQRRILKNRDESEYKRLHAEIQKETRRAKEEWYKEQCSEIESYETRHDSFNLHKKVKDLAGLNKKKSTSLLLDKNDKIIPDVKGKLDRWTEYVKELFEDTRKDQKFYDNMIGERGPSILKEEILHVINKSKTGKAPGPDKIPNDILKLIGIDHIDIFAALSDEIAGIKVNGLNINNVRFADDTALLAGNLKDLQLLLDKVAEKSEEFGLTLNRLAGSRRVSQLPAPDYAAAVNSAARCCAAPHRRYYRPPAASTAAAAR